MTNICRCGTYHRIRAAIKLAARAAECGAADREAMHDDMRTASRAASSSSAPPPPAAGSSLGFHVPFAGAAPPAQAAPPEINAWVVIKPDDTVVIRIARSEMGQGTLTGLAQLVAEELECDWAKVTTEYPTPGQNLARNRVWGDFSTGGSRGIRESHEYVRKGGAAARDDAGAGRGRTTGRCRPPSARPRTA